MPFVSADGWQLGQNCFDVIPPVILATILGALKHKKVIIPFKDSEYNARQPNGSGNTNNNSDVQLLSRNDCLHDRLIRQQCRKHFGER